MRSGRTAPGAQRSAAGAAIAAREAARGSGRGILCPWPLDRCRFAGDLKHHDAARPDDAEEFRDVPAAIARLHVLKRDPRIDEVEQSVGEQGEIVGFVEVILAAIAEAIERLRAREHGACDVNAVGPLEMTAERLRQPSHAAAEIECPVEPRRHAGAAQAVEHGLDLGDPCLEKGLFIPLTRRSVRAGEHRPHGVLCRQVIPGLPQLAQIHVGQFGSPISSAGLQPPRDSACSMPRGIRDLRLAIRDWKAPITNPNHESRMNMWLPPSPLDVARGALSEVEWAGGRALRRKMVSRVNYAASVSPAAMLSSFANASSGAAMPAASS